MPLPTQPSPSPLGSQVGKIVASSAVLAILYLGREVLVPITLAAIMSLLIAPLVRALKRIGLGQASAVLGAVAALTVMLLGLALVIGSQIISIASNLPQYEATLRSKIRTAEDLTVGRVESMQGEAGRIMSRLVDPASDVADGLVDRIGGPKPTPGVMAVEIHQPRPTPTKVLSQAFAPIWSPLGKTGIVLVVMIFVLLEYESLRDRFIRLAGGSDLQGTTRAFNDAGERLSRFFVSQFTVNLGVGIAIWIGLLCIGVPHAMFWAVLAAVLRFVPYFGVVAVALFAGVFAAAVDPGWSLVLMTLALFVIIELLAAQVVEPLLYGHTTGLSPLSIVVAAIFWSWIWGPIGLLLSTPLTLCLVVAGRHFQTLAFLDVLLGNSPALTLSQGFYQRALSNDADEIIDAAHTFLKRKTFAQYCDSILMPALLLARTDTEAGRISEKQQGMLRGAIVQVIETLGPENEQRSRRHRRVSFLDDPNIGQYLRHQRENINGKWQGPIKVPPGSIVLCVGLGSTRDDLVTEILVRVLRNSHIDARHLSVADLEGGPPPGATPGSVAMFFLISAFPAQELQQAIAVSAHIRGRYPATRLIGVVPTNLLADPDQASLAGSVELVAHSLEEALQLASVKA
jgi:predicted PurR-regulated permease PerM